MEPESWSIHIGKLNINNGNFKNIKVIRRAPTMIILMEEILILLLSMPVLKM
jgi:hypothetical protein